MKRCVLLMTMVFLALYGCGGGSGDGSPSTSDVGPQQTGLTVEQKLDGDSRLVGGTVQYNAIGEFEDGSTRQINNQCTFTSSDPLIADFLEGDVKGLLTALSEGEVTVQADCNEFTATSFPPLTVTDYEISSFEFRPPERSMHLDIPERFCAYVIDQADNEEEVCDETEYSGYDPDVLLYTSSGWFEGIVPGETVITGTFRGHTATAIAEVLNTYPVSLTVSPAILNIPVKDGEPITVTSNYDDGSQRDVTDLATWSSGNPDIAYYMNGQIWGNASGDTVLQVTWQGITSEIPVTVGN